MAKAHYAAFFALIALLVLILGAGRAEPRSAPRVAAADEPVLIELFTSQGCSSCPPADRLAAKLDRESGFVILSRPVDYWDRLGWKDTFASPANTALQRAYAKRGLGGRNGVYTPQSVVAGSFGDVGSDEAAIRRFVRQAAGAQTAAIRVSGSRSKGYGIGIAGSSTNDAELVLVGVSRRETVAVGRGENGGRSLAYTNVVLGERVLDRRNGGTASYPLAARALSIPRADRHALVLREPDAGKVLAAAWLD